MKLFPCPCCGFATLQKLGDDQICPVCWWHDDGQNNGDADEVRGGPNKNLSLTQARLNFLENRISCPTRTDLKEKAHDPLDYQQMRFFSHSQNGMVEKFQIEEEATQLDTAAMGKGWTFHQESTQGEIPVRVYYEHISGDREYGDANTKAEAKIKAAKKAIDRKI